MKPFIIVAVFGDQQEEQGAYGSKAAASRAFNRMIAHSVIPGVRFWVAGAFRPAAQVGLRIEARAVTA